MKVLVLLSRIPWPLEKGDKLRAYNHLKVISKKHQVILVCLTDTKPHSKAIENLSPYCEEIHFIKLSKIGIFWNLATSIFNDKPFQVNYFYQNSAQKKVDAIIEKHLPRHLFVQLIRTAEYVKKYHLFDSTFDYMDALSMGAQRRIDKAIPGVKTLLKIEAFRLKKYENYVFNQFTNKTIISKNDRDLIQHSDKDEIRILPNGVDFTLFHRDEKIIKKYELVFTGNMSYPPNIKAAQYLALEIMPILIKSIPQIKLIIAGTDPHSSVKRLASKNIIITGWLDQITDAYNESHIFIAPMQIGTGMQNKILEAMAMKIPCITSRLAAEAIGATHQKQILIANSPEEYAQFSLDLIQDSLASKQLAIASYNWVKKNYDWYKIVKKLLDLLDK
ncbi:MAG: glycosyltransferase involved in cell wall biosynthesis [Salibacteraceae bacterium]|jgi:glycosyltransferase involved in cell wall biosynthesis